MKPFTTIAVAIFTLMAVVHLLRLAFGWEVVVTGYVIPVARGARLNRPRAYFGRAPVSSRYRAMCRMASLGRESLSQSSARL